MTWPFERCGRAVARPVFFASLIVCAPYVLAQAQGGAPPPDQYFGIYMGGARVGYTQTRTVRAEWMAKPAWRMTTSGKFRINLLGQSLEQDEATDTVTDLRFQPLHQVFNVTSGGSAIHVTADYDYATRKISCAVGRGANASRKVLSIPPGADLAADSDFATEGKSLKAGQTQVIWYLEPTTVELDRATARVTGRTQITDPITNQPEVAWKVVTATTLGDMTSIQTADGRLISQDMSLGPISISFRAESPPAGAEKPIASYTPPMDFALATAVVTNLNIADPRAITGMQAVITGLPKTAVISDMRQRMNPDGEAFSIRVHALPLPQHSALNVASNAAGMQRWLEDAAYLDLGNATIKEIAARLRHGSTDPAAVATRIRDWVHQKITPDAEIGVPRSAADVLRNPRGVCRDYATLFAAVARDAGIPTRLCAGIVYFQGRFYYHAWDECWLGKWIAVDPTLYNPKHPEAFVDATHIKFAEGDPENMFAAVQVVGKIGVHITWVQPAAESVGDGQNRAVSGRKRVATRVTP
ncbi:MAG: transglutaminase domain-containing protein [Armatimonadetes bacterium]|nr:transglutaminase domain-containing protein [Armatimonadota bacterium]MDE2205058.1 transglutaminase domain-containing protein [Armatimonadota bacterium]